MKPAQQMQIACMSEQIVFSLDPGESVASTEAFRGRMSRCETVIVDGLRLVLVPGVTMALNRSGIFIMWLSVDSVGAGMSSHTAEPQQGSAAASHTWLSTCGPNGVRSDRPTAWGLHSCGCVVGPNLSLGTNSAIPLTFRDPRSDLSVTFDTIRPPESPVRLGD
jgi:hypothetical protein